MPQIMKAYFPQPMLFKKNRKMLCDVTRLNPVAHFIYIDIAKGVIGQSEHLLALIPTDTGILAETLFFNDEVKAMPKEPAKPELSEQEISMGKTIIGSMKEAFEPAKYHDEYRQRLWEIIQAKANNQEITAAPEVHSTNVISMMDALQQMVEQANKKSGDTPPKKPRSRKKASAS